MLRISVMTRMMTTSMTRLIDEEVYCILHKIMHDKCERTAKVTLMTLSEAKDIHDYGWGLTEEINLQYETLS